jgi:hypothetical protein
LYRLPILWKKRIVTLHSLYLLHQTMLKMEAREELKKTMVRHTILLARKSENRR